MIHKGNVESEKLLRQVLINIYNQKDQDVRIGEFSIKQVLDNDIAPFKGEGFDVLDLNEVLNRTESLRPVNQGSNRNDLGYIYDMVMQMCSDSHPEIRDHAVCIVKQLGFFGKLYSNNDGGVVVILSLAVFAELHVINQCFFLYASAECSVERRAKYLADMIRMLSNCMGTGSLSLPEHLPTFDTDIALEYCAVVSHVQQTFILLHEFGHMATSKRRQNITGGITVNHMSSQKNEFLADEWAVKKILEKGTNFFGKKLWLVSLFLLFEYMHCLDLVDMKKKSGQTIARKRYDIIRENLDPSDQFSTHSELIRKRSTFDSVIKYCDCLYQKVR